MLMVASAEVCPILPTLTDCMLGGGSVVNVCSFVPSSGKVSSNDACSTYSVPGDRFSRLLVAGLVLLVASAVSTSVVQSCVSALCW